MAGELLRQADVALARARAENLKALPFDPEQSERISGRRLQDIALRQALDRGEFRLLFQPQIDLATNRLIGVEALVRWQNESLGQVSPGDFIPLAEETGLIVIHTEGIGAGGRHLGSVVASNRPAKADIRRKQDRAKLHWHLRYGWFCRGTGGMYPHLSSNEGTPILVFY